MKTKSYWKRDRGAADPFGLPKRIATGLESSMKRSSEEAPADSPVRYIWIYVTEEGLQRGRRPSDADDFLDLDGWLNVIDEAGSLGAEWMVIHVGSSLSPVPYIWRLCDWAQSVHGLRVGLHVSNTCLSEDDLENLGRLEADKTYLLADKEDIDSLRFLEASGVHVCEANVRADERAKYCTKPGTITCVGPDGQLFSCGLVMGDDQYLLGDSQGRRLCDVMSDDSLPHLVPNTNAFPQNGCDACPPLVAERALEREV